jgi:hypothetical protein
MSRQGPDPSEIRGFELDDRNLVHMALHGLDGNLVYEVFSDGEVVFLLNPPTDTRNGSHLMVGRDVAGRHWTVVLVVADATLAILRPITGWASTRKELEQWREETSRQQKSDN